MTPARTTLSTALSCPDCGGVLEVTDSGSRCPRCVPDSEVVLLHATLSERSCALGHPGCEISTSDDLAI